MLSTLESFFKYLATIGRLFTLKSEAPNSWWNVLCMRLGLYWLLAFLVTKCGTGYLLGNPKCNIKSIWQLLWHGYHSIREGVQTLRMPLSSTTPLRILSVQTGFSLVSGSSLGWGGSSREDFSSVLSGVGWG